MEARFAKLESAIDAMTAAVTAQPKKKSKKKRNRDEEPQQEPPKKKKKKSKARANASHHEPNSTQDDQALIEIVEAQHQGLGSITGPPLTAASGPSAAATSSLAPPRALHPLMTPPTQVNMAAPMPAPNVNKPVVNTHGDWSDWLVGAGCLEPALPRPTTVEGLQLRDDVQAQVNSILLNTATPMSKGNKVKNFPFEYVLRGEEKRHTSMNSLTLPEHIWGIFALIKDPNTSNNIKPHLLHHIDEIVEDCREYDWPSAVRRWSEECFSLVAEGRLPNGWLSTGRIQLLRVTLSKVSTAKLNKNKDANAWGRNTTHHATSEAWKGAPPCTDYNSAAGCAFPSGHTVNGRKLQHVCAHCYLTTGATFHHTEINCRNKNRDKSHRHF